MLVTVQSGSFCVLVWCVKNIKIKTRKTIILSVVLNGYETLTDEHRLREFENRVLKRKFRLKRGKIQ
jgi:hypothetical protein